MPMLLVQRYALHVKQVDTVVKMVVKVQQDV
jgi:hypothetical protein